MSTTIEIWNNRLGFTTLAAPKELSPAQRAGLQSRLRLPPGGSIVLPVEIWQLMARRPGNWALVERGEISTRREDTVRKKPPTNLEKIDLSKLSGPKGAGDFVHGLRADPVLLRDVENAKRTAPGASSRQHVARAALDATRPGDYGGLLQELAAQGVDLSALRQHLAQSAPLERSERSGRASAPAPSSVESSPDESSSAPVETSKPEGDAHVSGERSSGRGKRS